MATGTAGTQARQLPWQAVHFMRKEVNYNTADIGTADTIKVGILPANAEIVDVKVNVKTAFNAGTTNVLTVGTNASSNNNIVSAADVDETATGVTSVVRGWGLSVTSDTTVYVRYTQSGTAATAGRAIIMIAYIPNIDQ